MNVGAPRTAARLIVEALERNGTERIFCVPGESYLALLDALYDSTIPLTVCRQEGGAAMMAEAWGKLSGKPGIVMTTRGPGGTNASAGLHIG
jgi:acetolactate synthase I/II/III large subunit